MFKDNKKSKCFWYLVLTIFSQVIPGTAYTKPAATEITGVFSTTAMSTLALLPGQIQSWLDLIPENFNMPSDFNIPDDFNIPGTCSNCAVITDGTVRGGNAKHEDYPTSGGSGGLVDIRTGVDVDVGDGNDGELFNVEPEGVVLTTGTYNFQQVQCVHLKIDGDVIIK